MAGKPSLTDFWRAQMTFVSLTTGAQTLIAIRTLEMVGPWHVSHDENSQMVSEKKQAVAQSAKASTKAITIARGLRPDQSAMSMAGTKPRQRKTRPTFARPILSGLKTAA